MNDCRHKRERNNAYYNWNQILIDSRNNTPKIISETRNSNRPQYCSKHIIKDKISIFHSAHTSNNWSKSSYNRHKSSNKNCSPAIFLIKKMGAFYVSFIKEKRIFFFKNSWANTRPKYIPHRIS